MISKKLLKKVVDEVIDYGLEEEGNQLTACVENSKKLVKCTVNMQEKNLAYNLQ